MLQRTILMSFFVLGAWAAPILPNSTVFLSVKSASPGPVITNGSRVLSPITTQWSGRLTFGAFLNGPNTVELDWQLYNNESSTDSIDRFTAINFTGFSGLDVFVRPAGQTLGGIFNAAGSVSPITADMDTGSTLGFTFGSFISQKVNPGQYSRIFGVEVSKANAVKAGYCTASDGGADTVTCVAPNFAAVPEPGTYACMGMGLLALGVLHRRWRTRHS